MTLETSTIHPAVKEKAPLPKKEYFSSIEGSKKSLNVGDSLKYMYDRPSFIKENPVVGNIFRTDGKYYIESVNEKGEVLSKYSATNVRLGLGSSVWGIEPTEAIPTKEKTASSKETESSIEAEAPATTTPEEAVIEKPISFPSDLPYEEAREQLLATQKKIEERKQELEDQLSKLMQELPASERKNLELKAKKEAFELIKGGIDRMVIHGGKKPHLDTKLAKNIAASQGRESYKNMEWMDVIQPDFDVRGMLMLLDLFAEVEGIEIYNDGFLMESIPKGSEEMLPTRAGEKTILYGDVGGRNFSIGKGTSVTRVYNDHHNSQKKFPTSATQQMAETLMLSPKFKEYIEENPWIKRLISFATNFDNLLYVDKKVEDGDTENPKNKFTKGAFANTWPKSLFGLALRHDVPFEVIRQAIEEGRDPWKPYTDEEIEKGVSFKNAMGEEETFDLLKDRIKKNKKDASGALDGVMYAQKEMEKAGIKTETSELGKIVYHNHAEGEDGETNSIKSNLAFLATKASGCDTYIEYRPKDGRIFINSSEKDLTPVFKRLEPLYPGLTLVRGVMIFAPKDQEVWKQVSEEQFLQAVGLK